MSITTQHVNSKSALNTSNLTKSSIRIYCKSPWVNSQTLGILSGEACYLTLLKAHADASGECRGLHFRLSVSPANVEVYIFVWALAYIPYSCTRIANALPSLRTCADMPEYSIQYVPKSRVYLCLIKWRSGWVSQRLFENRSKVIRKPCCKRPLKNRQNKGLNGKW